MEITDIHIGDRLRWDDPAIGEADYREYLKHETFTVTDIYGDDIVLITNGISEIMTYPHELSPITTH